MTDELKPVRCGCGGVAEVRDYKTLSDETAFYVSCRVCDTTTRSFLTKDKAITAWNRAMGEQAPLAKVSEIATRSYCGECGERLDDYDDICGEPPIKYCPNCGARLEWE